MLIRWDGEETAVALPERAVLSLGVRRDVSAMAPAETKDEGAVEGDGAKPTEFMLMGAKGAERLDEAEGVTTRMDKLREAEVMEAAFEAKNARIKKLRGSEPVKIFGTEIEITGNERQDKKNAFEYGKSLQGSYVNQDTGNEIQLQRGRHNGGVNEVLQHNYKDAAHLQSIAAIPQIIEKGIYISSEANDDVKKNPNVVEYQHYVCGLKIGEEDYTVHSLIAVDKQGNRYYDHNLTHIEKGKLLDQIEKGQAVEIDGFGTTPGTKPTTNTERKVQKLLSLLQINNAENTKKIKRATGWERGADGKWRYEMSDGNFAEGVFEDEAKGRSHWRLDEMWRDDALFAAYPELKGYYVNVDEIPGHLGSHNSDAKTITLSDEYHLKDMRSVMVHELQHAIQALEDFARGGSSRHSSEETSESVAGRINELVGFRFNSGGDWLSEDMVTLDDIAESWEQVAPYLNWAEIEDVTDYVQAMGWEDVEELLSHRDEFMSARNWYHNLAGEVEARNASTRMGFGEKERREKLLSETEDVARKDQIFLRHDADERHMPERASKVRGEGESEARDEIKYSLRSMSHDLKLGKMFKDLREKKVLTKKETEELRKNLEDLVEYMSDPVRRSVVDLNETYDAADRVFYPYKDNSDPLYKVSLDFSTLCAKRLLTQYVIESLETRLANDEQLRKARPGEEVGRVLTADEAMAVRDLRGRRHTPTKEFLFILLFLCERA